MILKISSLWWLRLTTTAPMVMVESSSPTLSILASPKQMNRNAKMATISEPSVCLWKSLMNKLNNSPRITPSKTAPKMVINGVIIDVATLKDSWAASTRLTVTAKL